MVSAVQQFICDEWPLWRARFCIDSRKLGVPGSQDTGEYHVLVYPHAVWVGMRLMSSEHCESELDAWKAYIDKCEQPWKYPKRRQLTRVKQQVKVLPFSAPISLVVAFDNHEGSAARWPVWIAHENGCFDWRVQTENSSLGMHCRLLPTRELNWTHGLHQGDKCLEEWLLPRDTFDVSFKRLSDQSIWTFPITPETPEN
jgi:hypothetical protein